MQYENFIISPIAQEDEENGGVDLDSNEQEVQTPDSDGNDDKEEDANDNNDSNNNSW